MRKSHLYVALPNELKEDFKQKFDQRKESGFSSWNVFTEIRYGVLFTRIDRIAGENKGGLLIVGKYEALSPQNLLLRFIKFDFVKSQLDNAFIGADINEMLTVTTVVVRSHYLCLSGTEGAKKNGHEICVFFDLDKNRVYAVEDDGKVHLTFAPFDKGPETEVTWTRADKNQKLPHHKNITLLTSEQMEQRKAAKLNAMLDSLPVVSAK